MIILMSVDSGPEALEDVLKKAEEMRLCAEVMDRGSQPAVLIRGSRRLQDRRTFQRMAGVEQVIPINPVSGLVSRDHKPGDTVIRVGDVDISGGSLAVIAGPCAVESQDQALRIAEAVAESGAKIFRAGAFKPRTSPYSFQGLGEKGLEILARVREETGLKIITEALDRESLPSVADCADMIQIGSRNMQNYLLLRAAGRMKKPIMLKRGMAATLEEWLLAAEYILAEGSEQVVLCERGVRTFSDHARFTLDLGVVPAVKDFSHLPVIIDPSHSSGLWSRVPAMARAAVAAGADGVMLEVHHDPVKALSDGPQSLDLKAFNSLMKDLGKIARALDLKF